MGKLFKYYNVYFFLAFLFATELSAQRMPWPTFKNGDRVCFVGNSITAQGHFHYFISLYYATRFPTEKLSFYNCGITGNTAAQILVRLDKDVLSLKPTYTVLMAGMNDVNRELYSKAYIGADAETKKQKAIAVYRVYTDSIVRQLRSKSKLILLRPSIYDQTGKLASENLFGVNDALKICCRQIDLLGKKYNLQVVDFWQFMDSVNHNVQLQNSSATIVGSDRVHPGAPGHFVMAYRFIKSTNPSKYVAKMMVDSKNGRVATNNCSIHNIKIKNGHIQFDCLEKSLPFPVQDDAKKALEWVPFQEDLNKELIVIKHLEKGKYQLLIDSTLIGNYSNTDFENGVDIAGCVTTPQYKQAQSVMKLLLARSNMQADLRKGKYAEFNYLTQVGLSDETMINEAKQYLDARLNEYKSGPKYDYIKENFDSYLNNRPTENKTLQKMADLVKSVYQINKPNTHLYTVVKN